jgi:hypothetical protein
MHFMASYKTGLFLLLVTLAVSCQKDIDVIRPELMLQNFSHPMISAQICGQTEDNVFLLMGGEILEFDAIFSDDNELSQYKIDIHHNFDCHGHGDGVAPGVVAPVSSGSTTIWEKLEVVDLTGSKVEKSFQLKVPENVTAGDYHFSIQVIDQSGNEPENTDIFSLKISNPNDTLRPILQINEPQSQQLIMERGNKLKVNGSLIDNAPLNQGGNSMVFLSYLDLTSGNSFSTNAFVQFNDVDAATANFELEYTIPLVWPRGNYRIFIGGFDGVRNPSEVFRIELEVR